MDPQYLLQGSVRQQEKTYSVGKEGDERTLKRMKAKESESRRNATSGSLARSGCFFALDCWWIPIKYQGHEEQEKVREQGVPLGRGCERSRLRSHELWQRDLVVAQDLQASKRAW